jgi:hypothetical protein
MKCYLVFSLVKSLRVALAQCYAGIEALDDCLLLTGLRKRCRVPPTL